MILRAYLPKFLTALFGGLVIVVSIFTFRHTNAFDWLFLLSLIFTAVVCRTNINIVSVIFILFVQLTLDKVIWLVLSEFYLFKIFFYILVLWTIYQLKYDWVVRIMLPSVILVASSEIYWFITQSPTPQVSWYIWLMASNLIVRYFIFLRVGLVDRYFPKKGLSINLDWIVYKLSAITIVIQTAILTEYVIRHILGFSNALLIYDYYPYLIQGIATIAIWAVFNESYKQLIPRLLKA